MTVAELIAALQALQEQLGPDAEVLAQSHGCCYHGHPIESVEAGGESEEHRLAWEDEVGCVVIRV